MARKNIQGINIEIGANTSKLQDALKKTESQLKSTQAALKDVGKLLKLDPKNVELLTQKQQLLTDSIKATREKLDTLRDAAAQANDQLARGEISQEQYDALQREIIETENDLKSLTKEMKEFGSVGAQQIAAVGEKVKSVGDGITKVGTGMSKYVTGPIVAAGAAATAAFNEVDESLDIIAVKTGATGEALEDMQNRAKNLATSIPTDFTTAGTAIGEVQTRFGLVGDALEDVSGKFIRFAQLNKTDVASSIDSVQAAMAAYRIDAERVGGVLDLLNKAGQDTGVSMDKLAADVTANATALKEMDYNFNSSVAFIANLNKNGVDASAVLGGMKKAMANAVKDGKSMSSAMAELTKRMKGAKSETEAMQIASELFGSKAGPAIAQAVMDGRLSFDALDNKVKDFEKSVANTFEATQDPIDGFKTAMNELKIVGADLVQAAAPMIKQLADMLKTMFANLREWWEGLSPMTQETIVQLAAIAAAVGPVLIVVGKLTGAVGSILSIAPQIVSIIGTVKTGLSALWGLMAANPIVAIIAAVAALAAAFAHFWRTSEKFRNFWINLWNGIRDTVKNAVDKIKEFFSFKWELPKIPLPHFKIEGSFSIAPPRVPKLSIDWYRKAMEDGMILTNPTIFGAQNGRLLGGGEAGPEAVVGVDSLKSMVAAAVAQAMPRGGAPRNMTVVLQLREAEVGRVMVPIIDAETQRVGVKLTAR